MMVDFNKLYKNFKGKILCKKNCSVCCQKAGDIILFPEEAEILIKKVPEAEKYIYKKKVNGEIIELIRQPCPFLKNGLCSIEESRPLDCRFYPFDYCLFDDKIILITSLSCPAIKEISENEKKKISKHILHILYKIPMKWIESSVLFGPCGNCDKKSICKLAQIEGYNDKDW